MARKSKVSKRRRPLVPLDKAKELLAIHKEDGKERVHSFTGGGFMLMGCEVDLSEVLERAQKHGIELSGPHMTRLQHGLVIVDDDQAVFYEVRKDKMEELGKLAAEFEATSGRA